MLPTFKLVGSYFIRGFAGPFFLFFFPLLLLLIIGEANIIPGYDKAIQLEGAAKDAALIEIAHNFRTFVGGLVAWSAITISFLQMPGTVIEFKNSVVLKRIGATRLKIWQFFLVLIGFYSLLAVIATFYLSLIAGILLASRMTELDNAWQYVLPDPNYWLPTIGYFCFFYIIMVLFGLVIGSILKKHTSQQIVSNFLFFPTSFLVGGFIPPYLIQQSDVLKAIQYVYIHTQPVIGFTTFWAGDTPTFPVGAEFDKLIILSLISGLVLIIVFSMLIKKFFKWNE